MAQTIFKCRDQFELADHQSDARLRLDHLFEALDILDEIRREGSEADRAQADALAEKYAVVVVGWLPQLSRIDEPLWKSYVGTIFFGLAGELDKLALANPVALAKWTHFSQLHPVSHKDLRKYHRAWR